jgi:hypothetical protein
MWEGRNQTMKEYLLVDNNGFGGFRFSLVSLKSKQIVAMENHIQYLIEDYGSENIIYNINEIEIIYK